MKKTNWLVPALVTIATIVNVGIWNQSEKRVPSHATNDDGIVFMNDKVAIKYFDEGTGYYDILVETRNGTNITSEWDLKPTQNGSFAYLIGRDEKTAKEFFDKNLKNKGYAWNWEETYPIEGIDTPTVYPK